MLTGQSFEAIWSSYGECPLFKLIRTTDLLASNKVYYSVATTDVINYSVCKWSLRDNTCLCGQRWQGHTSYTIQIIIINISHKCKFDYKIYDDAALTESVAWTLHYPLPECWSWVRMCDEFCVIFILKNVKIQILSYMGYRSGNLTRRPDLVTVGVM